MHIHECEFMCPNEAESFSFKKWKHKVGVTVSLCVTFDIVQNFIKRFKSTILKNNG